MKSYTKKDFPVSKVRRFLEPGPVVLVSSAYRGERDVMTMGWHMILEFEPSLVGCFVWDQNHSHELIRKSKQAVINLPTADLIDQVIDIGNLHGGRDVDKSDRFGLTAARATKVDAPLIAECYANFECKLVDTSLIKRYSLFVFEVVKAHVATSPKYPKTVHYRGDGVFMMSGPSVSYRKRFKAVNLQQFQTDSFTPVATPTHGSVPSQAHHPRLLRGGDVLARRVRDGRERDPLHPRRTRVRR